MHRRLLYLVLAGIFLAGIFQASFVVAQGPPQGRFEQFAPQLGDLIPDLEIVDDHGNPVSLRELTRGQYTVFTLGCLT